MPVYVDDARIPYRGMKMCHMIADTDAELHAMADRIGVARRHHQDTMSGSHYDIASSKALDAIRAGAKNITVRQAAMMTQNRRKTGSLGAPDPYYGPGYDPVRSTPERVVEAPDPYYGPGYDPVRSTPERVVEAPNPYYGPGYDPTKPRDAA